MSQLTANQDSSQVATHAENAFGHTPSFEADSRSEIVFLGTGSSAVSLRYSSLFFFSSFTCSFTISPEWKRRNCAEPLAKALFAGSCRHQPAFSEQEEHGPLALSSHSVGASLLIRQQWQTTSEGLNFPGTFSLSEKYRTRKGWGFITTC